MIPAVSRGRWIAVYAGWIALCAILFLALAGVEDPSRRRDRILSNDAGRRALSLLRQSDRSRFREFEVVHVAYAGAGEGGEGGRWVVLCDRVPHSGLRKAVVVEVDARGGRLVRVRKPEW